MSMPLSCLSAVYFQTYLSAAIKGLSFACAKRSIAHNRFQPVLLSAYKLLFSTHIAR